MIKEIEDDPKKWKDTPYSWTGRINTGKMPHSPEQTTNVM